MAKVEEKTIWQWLHEGHYPNRAGIEAFECNSVDIRQVHSACWPIVPVADPKSANDS